MACHFILIWIVHMLFIVLILEELVLEKMVVVVGT
jgi:hypothetical protein